MRLVQASGTIRMGSPRREQGRRNNEFEYQTSFSRAFYMGIREVTNAEVAAFFQNHDSGVVDKNTLALAQQPAVRLSWNDAARYCNWLSEQDGLPPAYREEDKNMFPVTPMTTGYRLPTEAEWVLVARYEGTAGNRAPLKYSWGSQLPPPLAAGNFAGQESARLVERAISNYRDQFPTTAPVGVFEPNSLGIYDLGGNVREWIHDYYAIASARNRTIPMDSTGPESGTQHVIRGSGWRSGTIANLRLAWRAQGLQGGDDLGFRIARYAEEVTD
jgi:formylglycine-generating enzyme required for sulfatase activity